MEVEVVVVVQGIPLSAGVPRGGEAGVVECGAHQWRAYKKTSRKQEQQ